MKNKYIEQLSHLYLEQHALKRELDLNFNQKKRYELYNKIKANEIKISQIKEKNRLLKEIKKDE